MHRQLLAITGVFLAAALSAGEAQALTTLFQDTFDRADSRDIDATTTGITNNTGTTFGASAVYSQPFLDPNNAAPTFGVQDGDAANGGGAQILANNLQLAVGQGTSNAFINHNFVNNAILSDGGFKVSVDILSPYGGTTNGQGGAFAIGMTQLEAASARDAQGAAPNNSLTHAFAGTPNTISDFWVGLRGNNTLAWGSGNGTVMTANVGAKTGTISATFAPTSFNAGSTVAYEVFFNGVSQGVGSFAWSDSNANYIGLDARDGQQLIFDNFTIETILPPPKPTLSINRDTGNITLKNLTNSQLAISAYSMITANGGFNQANWTKIQGRDANDTWITFTAASSTTDLAEGTLGQLEIAAQNAGTTDELSLGNAWRRSPYEDVAFELRDANGNEVPTVVEFVGNGGFAYQEGDFSLNGALDAADWQVLKSRLTSDVSSLAPLDRYFAGDLNNDGLVNQTDFREFKGMFPATGPNSFAAITGVPEPATAMLALIAGSFFAVRRARSGKLMAALLVAIAACGSTLDNRASAADLFVDTFDRADSFNLDASTQGITGSAGATLSADNVYISPFHDPNAETGAPNADAVDGGGYDIAGGQLRLALGAGTSNAYVNHNFTDSAIATAKGFRVTIDVASYAGASNQQGGAFGIGMSAVEAASVGDAFNGHAPGEPLVFGPKMQSAFSTVEGTSVSDFWLALRGNNTLAWGNGATTVLGTSAVGAKTGTISAEFYVNDFNAGSQVAYQVFYNGASQGFGAFAWSESNANFIGLDARDGTAVAFDNFKIESVSGLAPQMLRLQVNTSTGAASIVGGGSSDSLDFYEITSAGGGLLAGGFNGIRGDGGLPSGNGTGNGWELGGANTANSLTEAYLNGESTIAANASAMSLGTIWNTAANLRDLTFTYYDSTGAATTGFIEYVTSAVQSADFDGNGRVDGADFLTWQRNAGSAGGLSQGDANGDGQVNATDLGVWKATFGQTASSAAVGAVPEPAAALLAVGLLGSLWMVRRRTADDAAC